MPEPARIKPAAASAPTAPASATTPAEATATPHAPGAHPAPARGPDAPEEMVMFLERDQLVVDTARPVPRARLGRRATLALLALRVVVIVVGAMVIYTFASQVA